MKAICKRIRHAVQSLWAMWCSAKWSTAVTAGRPGHIGCRVSESILATWMSQNLSRGRGTLVETGPIGRFADVGNYASYARCVESRHTSNGRKKGQGNTKNGNKYLAWAFVEAANFARRYHAPAKRFYERKKARTNNFVATKALAQKLARACYHILKEGKPFDVARCFA